ncbi:MAG TPA: 2OG-Fe(II) oxygenase, partial [Accumulibacter sp.]|nr:2OG-Fe(II) oxygenase [Accumulibacter sp.]
MPALPLELAHVLQAVRRPGDFFATGRIEIFAPKIEVAGVGAVSLPLLATQAEQLIDVAEQAPYGRGEETLVDTAVRRTWQIAADRIRLGGRHWDSHLADIVARAAAGLGVMEGISAELYKMLVYDTGSFFVGHRDTEKAPGMFATLVVVLPSIYSGGELLIRHREREVCLDLSCQEASEVAFA